MIAAQRSPKRLFIFHGEDFHEAEEHFRTIVAARLKSSSPSTPAKHTSPSVQQPQKLQKSQHSQPTPHTQSTQNTQGAIMRFYGEEDSVETVIETASTPPLFDPHVFIMFYHYDKVRDKKNLATLIENIHPNNILYLVKQDKPFHSASFETKIKKLPYAQVTLQFFISESSIKTRIQKAFKKANLSLGPEALHYLSTLFLSHPTLIQSEVEKYLAYFSERTTPIRVEDFSDILAFESSYGSNDVIDAVLGTNKLIMLRRFLVFLNGGGNLGELVLFLTKETQRLIQYHEERTLGRNENDIFTHMRIFYKKHQQILKRRASHFSLHSLERLLASLLEIDETLKSENFTNTLKGGFSHSLTHVNQKAKCQLERAVLSFT